MFQSIQVDRKHNRIEFKDLRFYVADDTGRPVPSVTTINQAAPKPPQYYEWLKKYGNTTDTIAMEAMEKGSHVHGLCDRYNKGEQDISAADENGRPIFTLEEWAMFHRYIEFFTRYQPKVLMSEASFALSQLGFGGTMDILVEIDGKVWLIDIKTGNMYEYYWMQLAAYKKLLLAQFYNLNYTEINIGILHLNAKTRGEDKKGKLMQGYGWRMEQPEHDDEHYWELFLATKKMWEFQNPNARPDSKVFELVVNPSKKMIISQAITSSTQ